MEDHLSCIGLEADSSEEFQRLGLMASKEGELQESQHGFYSRWDQGNGAEIWARLDRERRFIGLQPHFSGKAIMRLSMWRRIDRDVEQLMDGALHAASEPRGDDPRIRNYDLIFDVPNYDSFRRWKLLQMGKTDELGSVICYTQMAAFAYHLNACKDLEEFNRTVDGRRHLTSRYFVASGIWNRDLKTMPFPLSEATFAGHVLETETRVNSFSGNEFLWALVDNLAGKFDVVADPKVINGAVVKGGIITGKFWLSGRPQVPTHDLQRPVFPWTTLDYPIFYGNQ